MFNTINCLDDKGLQTYTDYIKTFIDNSLSPYMTKVDPVGSGTFSFGREDGSTIGQRSIVFGSNVIASGKDTVALGRKAKSIGNYAISIGYNNNVTGDNGIAIGVNSTASSGNSVTIGSGNVSNGWGGIALGGGTASNGNYSLASGSNTIADGDYSISGGFMTQAVNPFQTVIGSLNIVDETGENLITVGNGDASSDAIERSNAFTLDKNGNAWFSGNVYVGSTSGTDKDSGSNMLPTIDDDSSNKSKTWSASKLDETTATLYNSIASIARKTQLMNTGVNLGYYETMSNLDSIENYEGMYVKISDKTPTTDDFIKNGFFMSYEIFGVNSDNASITDIMNGAYEMYYCTSKFTEEEISYTELSAFYSKVLYTEFDDNDEPIVAMMVMDGISFPLLIIFYQYYEGCTPGIYVFPCVSHFSMGDYKLTDDIYDLTQIKNFFADNTITNAAKLSDTVVWDGTTDGSIVISDTTRLKRICSNIAIDDLTQLVDKNVMVSATIGGEHVVQSITITEDMVVSNGKLCMIGDDSIYIFAEDGYEGLPILEGVYFNTYNTYISNFSLTINGMDIFVIKEEETAIKIKNNYIEFFDDNTEITEENVTNTVTYDGDPSSKECIVESEDDEYGFIKFADPIDGWSDYSLLDSCMITVTDSTGTYNADYEIVSDEDTNEALYCTIACNGTTFILFLNDIIIENDDDTLECHRGLYIMDSLETSMYKYNNISFTIKGMISVWFRVMNTYEATKIKSKYLEPFEEVPVTSNTLVIDYDDLENADAVAYMDDKDGNRIIAGGCYLTNQPVYASDVSKLKFISTWQDLDTGEIGSVEYSGDDFESMYDEEYDRLDFMLFSFSFGEDAFITVVSNEAWRSIFTASQRNWQTLEVIYDGKEIFNTKEKTMKLKEGYIPAQYTNNILPDSYDYLILNSSTEGSTKQFKLTVDDNGALSAVEI